MKKFAAVFCVVMVVLVTAFNSCKEHTTPSTPGMTLVSLTSGGVNLLEEDPNDTARNLSVTDNIVATFSNDIDFLSINSSNVTLRRDTSLIQLNFVIDGRTLTIDPTVALTSGTNFVLEMTNNVRSTNGYNYEGRTSTLQTEGIGVDTPPRGNDQILYLQLNGSVQDLTGHDTLVTSGISYTVDRFGIASYAGNFLGGNVSGPIVVLSGDTLITASMTISTWINVSLLTLTNLNQPTYGVFGYAGSHGYYFEIGCATSKHTPKYITWGTHHVTTTGKDTVALDTYYRTNDDDSIKVVLRDGWHHLVLTYDATTTNKRMYIDGVKKYERVLNQTPKLADIAGMALEHQNAAVFTPDLAIGYYVDKIYLGSPEYPYYSATNTFSGALDDFRMYRIPLSAAEVQRLYEMELGNSR